MDTEQARLKEMEQHARALYERLRNSASADPIFVKTAERLWKEAAEAVRLHEANRSTRDAPQR